MSTTRRRVIAAVAAILGIQAAAVGLYIAVERGRTADDTPFRVEQLSGKTLAPNITLEREDGTRVAVHDLGGEVRIVHFWATWCPPCIEELPGLLATSRALASQGLTLAAISMDDDWSAIREFFNGDVPADVYRAVNRGADQQYDIVSLPDTYLVGRRQRLLVRYGGARSWSDPKARAHLSAWLRRSSAR
jgi:thiol-disulfide isomerase/thioredoxin